MFGPGGVDLRGGQGFPPWAVFENKLKKGCDKRVPVCTLLVSSETCVAQMANSTLSDGTTAVAENQSVMAPT
jgi:hypothetical protein